MPKRIRFTKYELDALTLPPPGERMDVHDTGVNNLTVRVTAAGVKRFYVMKRTGRNTTRISLGTYPVMSIEAARKKALTILAEISTSGVETLRQGKPAEVMLDDLLTQYLEGHAKRNCARWNEAAANFERYYGDWKARRATDISIREARKRMDEIADRHGKHAANRSLNDVRAAVNWCIEHELFAGENPWNHVSSVRTESRERFITPEEMPKFLEAVYQAEDTTRDFILMCLFTGARKTNVMTMRWEQIDFDLKAWRIPKTKSGTSHIVPLTQRALEILHARHKDHASGWVFPGTATDGHIPEPNRSWHKVLQVAGIADLRVHDLRRTHASYMAMSGQSLPMIGKVLGHKSPTATQVYARLALTPVKEAMETALDHMLSVVKLPGC